MEEKLAEIKGTIFKDKIMATDFKDGILKEQDMVMLREDNFEWLINQIEQQQQEIKNWQGVLTWEKSYEKESMERGQVIEQQQKVIERMKKALEEIAYKGFNVDAKRTVVKMQAIARNALGN